MLAKKPTATPPPARDLLGRKLGNVRQPEGGGLQLGSQSPAGKAVLALGLVAFAKMALALAERAIM